MLAQSSKHSDQAKQLAWPLTSALLLKGYEYMEDIVSGIVSIFLIGGITLIAVTVFGIRPISKRLIEASRAAEKEDSDLKSKQISSGIFSNSPKEYIRLEELQRNYKLIVFGLKLGWVPFIIITISSLIALSELNADSSSAVIVILLVVFTLIIFYSFLFKQSLKISAKISTEKIELAAHVNNREK